MHPVVAEKFREWLEAKDIKRSELVFALKSAGGNLRSTSKMMRLDLQRARNMWIEAASDEDEREKRTNSDVLTYCNEDGLFADFHANRHTFVSNLGKAGIAPKPAQTLARHRDPILNMNVYTHVE